MRREALSWQPRLAPLGRVPGEAAASAGGGDPRPAPSTAAIVPALSGSIGTATSSGQPGEPENQGDNDRDQYSDQEKGEVGAGERDERCCSASSARTPASSRAACSSVASQCRGPT